MSESSKKWYVLRAAGGKEKKAKEYLEKEIERCGLQDLVSQVLVPTEKVYRIRDGKRICTERLFYPGYVLIEAELTGELQHIIRNEVPHMSGFLTEKREVKRGEGKPQEEKLPIPLRDDEVRRIIYQQDDEAVAEADKKAMNKWSKITGICAVICVIIATIQKIAFAMNPEGWALTLENYGFEAFYCAAGLFGMVAMFLHSDSNDKVRDPKALPINLSLFKTNAGFALGSCGIIVILVALYALLW